MSAINLGPGGHDLATRSARSLGPRLSRVAIYFSITFGLFLLPFALVGLDFAVGPAPYTVHPELLPRGVSSVQRFDDGSTVTVLVRSSSAAAKAAIEGIWRAPPTRSLSETNAKVSITRFFNSASGRAVAWLRIDRVAIGVEAADREAVDRRLAHLAVVTKNPHIDPLFELFDRHLGSVAIGIGIYMLAIAFFMLRGASWAGRIEPDPDAVPVSADELQSRLLQVNQLDLPWRLEEIRPGVFQAEWVYADARWLQLQGAGRIRFSQRLTLRLDPDRTRVSVIESSRSLSWRAGLTGFFANLSYWRGITFFAYESDAAVGLGFRDGKWQLAEAYRYRFSATEMRNPLVEAVVDGGWTYAPSLTLVRWLGG